MTEKKVKGRIISPLPTALPVSNLARRALYQQKYPESQQVIDDLIGLHPTITDIINWKGSWLPFTKFVVSVPNTDTNAPILRKAIHPYMIEVNRGRENSEYKFYNQDDFFMFKLSQ
jgi:hypothetical protein